MNDEIRLSIDGPGKVTAHFGDFVIRTDHPPDDEREERDPTPWSMFLASIGACAASFVAAAAQEEGIDPSSLRLVMRHDFRGDAGCALDVAIEIEGAGEARERLVAAANRCTVKHAIEEGTTITIS
jgi:ribosomal protein S12 methylthiotransferase accessory factor